MWVSGMVLGLMILVCVCYFLVIVVVKVLVGSSSGCLFGVCKGWLFSVIL